MAKSKKTTKKPAAKPALSTNADVNREIGDAALKERTGRDWKGWKRALDADGCRKMDHKSIARHVHATYELNGWWSQMVTVGYERLAGLRERHEKADGFSASASKTIAVDLGSLYRAWSDARQRRKWLGAEQLRSRTATANKSLRFDWSDGVSRVNVYVYAKGPDKSLVTVEHHKLPDAASVAKMKSLWRERLEALKSMLER